MKINRKFNPFSIEIESHQEVEDILKILLSYIRNENKPILSKYYPSPLVTRAEQLYKLLENT